MAIKVFWTHFAKTELKKIFEYYKEEASIRVAKNLVEGIVKKGHSFDYFSEIGQKEELLLDRKENFRYLIYKSYKLIYWFNKDKNRIEIVDVFDTRQEPTKIKREK